MGARRVRRRSVGAGGRRAGRGTASGPRVDRHRTRCGQRRRRPDRERPGRSVGVPGGPRGTGSAAAGADELPVRLRPEAAERRSAAPQHRRGAREPGPRTAEPDGERAGDFHARTEARRAAGQACVRPHRARHHDRGRSADGQRRDVPVDQSSRTHHVRLRPGRRPPPVVREAGAPGVRRDHARPRGRLPDTPHSGRAARGRTLPVRARSPDGRGYPPVHLHPAHSRRQGPRGGQRPRVPRRHCAEANGGPTGRDRCPAPRPGRPRGDRVGQHGRGRRGGHRGQGCRRLQPQREAHPRTAGRRSGTFRTGTGRITCTTPTR